MPHEPHAPGSTLLYLAPNWWDGPRQRPQHLAEELSRSRRVLFVEPAARPRLMNGSAGSHGPGSRCRSISDTLRVFSPGAALPGGLDLRAINRFNHRRAWRQLRAHLPPAGSALDVILGWPPAVDLVRLLGPDRLVYDGMDLFPAFFAGRRRAAMESFEAEIAVSASGVIAPSRGLQERWSARHAHVARIANGVDVDHFISAHRAPAEDPHVMRLPRPRIGYIGTIGAWLDLPALGAVARAHPAGSVVLIGPREQGAPLGPHEPNLHYLGSRPYDVLPGVIASLDVLLIPFLLTELTQAVDPIKFYEYRAAGKPIASTPLDEVRAHGHLCHLGEGPGFVTAVNAALAEAAAPDPAQIAARQAFARECTWRRRAGDVARFMDERPARRREPAAAAAR